MTVTASGHGRHTIAAEGFLRALADHGVDYFFCNPGTDFPPIVEAFSRAKKTNAKVPKPVLVPHENLAVAMAHGAYLMNGRPQAVMVHVNVGTGNTINNITNMSRDRVPLILAAGRTPITEQGQFGSRSRPIHWAQEMFDQAGMLRELVKWDYELRQPRQVGDVVARAVEVSMAHPRGPVYLVLPREPLAAPLAEPTGPAHPRPIAVAPHPDPRQIETLADWLSSAERPLIIPGALPADAVEPLSKLAERCAIPVVPHNPRTVCLPSSHHMHFGNEPGALLADADLVIVLDSDVPWIPSLQHPPAGCHVAHVGEDPFYVRYPMRSFPSDLAIQAGVTNTLVALAEAMEQRLETTEARIAARRARLTERMRNRHIQLAKDSAPGDTISPEYLSRVIGETVGPDAVIFNEYPLGTTIARARSPAPFSRSAQPGDWAGASAPRSAPSWRRRTSSLSRPSATAPTCSAIRPSPIGSRRYISCRCWRSCSTTAAMAPYARPRSPCSRTASPVKVTAANWPTSVPRRRTMRSPMRRAPMPSAWRNRPTCRRRFSARARPSSRGGDRRCSMSSPLTERLID